MSYAVDRTAKRFMDAVRAAVPEARLTLSRSVTLHGRSNYVHIYAPHANGYGEAYWKVRISDHAVGMRRAKSGMESLYLEARAKPHQWLSWIANLRRQVKDLEIAAPAPVPVAPAYRCPLTPDMFS